MGIRARHIAGAGFIATAYKQWMLLTNPRKVIYTETSGSITRQGEYYDTLPGGHLIRGMYIAALLGIAAKCYEPELEYLLRKADEYGTEFGRYVRGRLEMPRDSRRIEDM